MNYVTSKVKPMTQTLAIMMMRNSKKHLYLKLRNKTKVTTVLTMITIIIKRLV